MPLPLTVPCFSKTQIDFIFLVPAHPGSPGKRAVKWLCVVTFYRWGGQFCKHFKFLQNFVEGCGRAATGRSGTVLISEWLTLQSVTGVRDCKSAQQDSSDMHFEHYAQMLKCSWLTFQEEMMEVMCCITHTHVQRRLASSSDVDTESDQDSFFEMLSRYQGRRIDDQRCCLISAREQHNKENIDLCGQLNSLRMSAQYSQKNEMVCC